MRGREGKGGEVAIGQIAKARMLLSLKILCGISHVSPRHTLTADMKALKLVYAIAYGPQIELE